MPPTRVGQGSEGTVKRNGNHMVTNRASSVGCQAAGRPSARPSGHLPPCLNGGTPPGRGVLFLGRAPDGNRRPPGSDAPARSARPHWRMESSATPRPGSSGPWHTSSIPPLHPAPLSNSTRRLQCRFRPSRGAGWASVSPWRSCPWRVPVHPTTAWACPRGSTWSTIFPVATSASSTMGTDTTSMAGASTDAKAGDMWSSHPHEELFSPGYREAVAPTAGEAPSTRSTGGVSCSSARIGAGGRATGYAVGETTGEAEDGPDPTVGPRHETTSPSPRRDSCRGDGSIPTTPHRMLGAPVIC